MSGHHPGTGSGPAPDSARDAATAPSPVTTPPAADYGGAAPAASAGPVPGPAWGMPPQQRSTPAPGAGWGAPGGGASNAAAARPWTLKRGLVVTGAAAVLAAGAGAGIYALSSSSAAAANSALGAAGGQGAFGQGSAPGIPGSGQDGFAGGGMSGHDGPDDFAAGGLGGMGTGLSSAVHADYVVLQGSDYITMAEQTGTVSEVSPSAVTVKSSDGFTRTYALGSDVEVRNLQQRRQSGGAGTQLSVADIIAGGTVRIVAAKDGSGYTAATVMVVPAASTGQSN